MQHLQTERFQKTAQVIIGVIEFQLYFMNQTGNLYRLRIGQALKNLTILNFSTCYQTLILVDHLANDNQEIHRELFGENGHWNT